MADSTLNRFVSSGTTAERTAFVPDPPTPASGPDVLYLWWDTTLEALYAYDFGAPGWVAAGGSGGIGGSTGGTDEAVLVADGTGGATLQATPVTINSATGAITFPDDVRQTFNPGANNAGLNVGSLAGDPATPSNGDLWYDSTAGELTARIAGANVALGAGGGGGNAIDSTAFGAEPGSPATGDVDLYSDVPFLARYSGSAWAPWGPTFPLTLPVNGSYSWVNQGASTIDASKGIVALFAPAASGDNLRIRTKIAPATPYVLTAALSLAAFSANSSVGIGLRESSSGKLSLIMSRNDGALYAIQFNSPTSFNAINVTGYLRSNGLLWMQIEDTGASRIMRASTDGVYWTVLYSTVSTSFITPDEVCFFCNAEGGHLATATLWSWLEA